MDRRNFLRTLFGTGAAVAVDPSVLWTPTKTIFIPASPKLYNGFVSAEWITAECLKMLQNNLTMVSRARSPLDEFITSHKIGNTIRIAYPQRYEVIDATQT